MKTKIISLVTFLFLLGCINLNSEAAANSDNAPSSGTLSIYSAPELFNLTTAWANEYNKLNVGAKVIVKQGDGQEMMVQPGSSESIYFVSGSDQTAGSNQPVFQIVVGHEIIVPVINMKNPYISEIFRKGISREAFVKSLGTAGTTNWGTLLTNSQNNQANYYILNDDFTKSHVAGFLNVDPAVVGAMKSESREQLVKAIQSDPYAIGFCRLNDILNPASTGIMDNIQLLPIDKNGNGKLDYMENIYDNIADFSRGVWIGKYPKVLASNIIMVAGDQPGNATQVAFIQWILTSGQSLLSSNGYSELANNERESQISRLISSPIIPVTPNESNSLAKMVLLVMVVIVVLSIAVDQTIRRYKAGKAGRMVASQKHADGFDENHVNVPGGLYFDKTHTWAFMEQDGTVKIGIDDFMQHITGPISRIDMIKAGEKIRKGDLLCTIIQKGKQLKIYAPISGVVKVQNKLLANDSSMVNQSPYNEGWLYMIEPSNWLREITFLSMADQYRTWLKSEFTRLKDFLAEVMQPNTPGLVRVALQDGGVIRDHVLADLGPEVWEEFQTKFINAAR